MPQGHAFDVRRVTKGKAICLFSNLLKQTGFQRLGVVDHLVEEVHLVGEEPPCSLFAKCRKCSTVEPEQLETQSPNRREALRRTRRFWIHRI